MSLHFIDFEVFKYDWLCVIFNPVEKYEYVICNDAEELRRYYEKFRNEIFVTYNGKHYDQYIFKAIMCDFNPKEVNDFIIAQGGAGYQFSSLFRKIPLNIYDVMNALDRGLKTFEGFMGNDIKETTIPFDIDRKLTNAELEEVIEYCKHDVKNTMEVFLERKDDFDAHMGLVKIACQGKGLDLSLLSNTKVQLSAIILEASNKSHDDEFNIDIPYNLQVTKYRHVVDWYLNPENRNYDKSLTTEVAGVEHVFGWGGVHGAIEKYCGEGYFLNMDIALNSGAIKIH